MKRGFKYYGIIWLILVLAFNLIVFVTPSEFAGMNKFGGAFWTGYAFIMLAFIGQAVCSYLFFSKSDSMERRFLNLPLITISYTGLILSVVVGAVCMAVPNLPNWLGAVVAVLVLVFYAVAVIKASAAAEAVESVDKKRKAQTFFVKSLTVDLQTLAAKAKNEVVKAEVSKIADVCRYSDPMSNDALVGVEGQITIKFHALEKAVEENSIDTVQNLCEEMNILFADRNKKCKLLK